MARGSVSIPRDNSLEELRVVIEEKKGEVKRKFAELKKLLDIPENTATYRLDRIYTDVRKDVERNERTVIQLEQAKNDLNSTLVDNNTNVFLQTANQNFDAEIARARNSACVVPKHISLRWSIGNIKQCIENVCEVISSSTAETPVSTEQPNKIELEGVRKELEQRTKELVSLQKEKLQMQMNYQNEISNLKSSLEELNYNCSSLKAELQKQSEHSKHTLTTESADKEDRITSLTTHIRELEDKLTTKDTYITRSYSELKNIRIYYSNLEKELRTLKSANQQRRRNEVHTNPLGTPDAILQYITKVKDLGTQLTLKNSECEDLQRKVVSLQSDLREAQDVLAASLESPREFGESVHLSLSPGFTRKDYSSKTSQTADVDYVRIPKKEMEEYETNTQDLKSQISQLQKQLESKETEIAFLRASLNDSRKELENTRLQLQQTQQANPTKVQSKRDSQTGTVVEEKQAQYSQVVSKHKQQPKYTMTTLFVNGKYSQFYTLSQVNNPSELVGELVVCRAKGKYVIGTLKVVIPAKLKYQNTIAGIEFTDVFGNCSGSYTGISYFKTNSKCALFIPTTEVFIYYNGRIP